MVPQRPFSILIGLILGLSLAACGSDTPTDAGDTDSRETAADTVPPAAVTDLVVSYDEASGLATLRWTAPSDGPTGEAVDRYEVRFALTRDPVPTDFWHLSVAVLDPPAPLQPGREQVFQLVPARKAANLWVGVRSYDRAHNRSPASDLAMAFVPGFSFEGLVIDALESTPVIGARTRILAGAAYDSVTTADGRFGRDNLPPGSVGVSIESGFAAAIYHPLNQVFVLDADSSHTFAMIPVQSTISPALHGMSLLAFLKQLLLTRSQTGVFAKWYRWPIPIYVPSLVNGSGIDYHEAALSAIDRWQTRTQRDLFEIVAAPPDTGIVVEYRTRADMGIGNGVTVFTLDDKDHPIGATVQIIDEFADAEKLFRIIMHELGHTLLLGHLDTQEFIMFAGQPLPSDVSEDEVNVVRLMMSLPTLVPLDIYGDSVLATTTETVISGPSARGRQQSCGGVIIERR